MSVKTWWRSFWSVDEDLPAAPHCRVFKDEANAWRFHVRGANGEIMCTSEAYANYGNAVRAAESLILNPPQTVEVVS